MGRGMSLAHGLVSLVCTLGKQQRTPYFTVEGLSQHPMWPSDFFMHTMACVHLHSHIHNHTHRKCKQEWNLTLALAPRGDMAF